MAAAEAVQSIAAAEKRVLTEQYGGKLSNKFIDELKASTLFQFDWGELLSAAPTALYFMGSCWLAAANPTAEMISLAEVVPNGGFKYLTNLRKPTLRACLVDVCNNGGRQAFTIAGKNMDALHMISRRICDERIDVVFKRLGPCTANADALEDFNDALQDLSKDAHRCAELATEMREAFSKWGKMVGELNMCTENQVDIPQEQPPPPYDDDPSYANAAEIRDLVNHFYSFIGSDNGPIDWEKFKKSPGANGTIKDDESQARDCLSYQTQAAGANEPQGLAYLLGTLRGLRQNTDVTGTKANNKLMEAYKILIEVGTEIQNHLSQQNRINAVANPSDQVVQGWKEKVKKAQTNVLNLAASANARSSSSVPRPFGNVNIQGLPDSSMQKAQLSTALQSVQIAQAALESAQSTYGAARAKQEQTAKAMVRIQAKLKKLHEEGQNLERIKDVLRDCISVLVDLAVQIRKLEQFFIMLANVIDHIVLPRAETFTRAMTKVGRGALRDGAINADDITKQTIYTSTLQIKGYFSVLQDISEMYTLVHQRYINKGVDLCYSLSKGTATNGSMSKLQESLADYSDQSAKEIAALASAKQAEVLRSLKDRARKALEHTQLIENEVAKRGIAIEESAKLAIKEGGEHYSADATRRVNNDVSLTASEQTDGSSY